MFGRVLNTSCGSIHLEVFLRKGILKICSKFTGEHPCRSAISIKLLCNFIEITLRHGCSPVSLLHIFKSTFSQEHLWMAISDLCTQEISTCFSLTLSSELFKNNQTYTCKGLQKMLHWWVFTRSHFKLLSLY